MTCWLCGFNTTKLAKNADAPTCKNGPCQACIAVEKVDKEIDQAVATLRRLLAKRCDLYSKQNRAHDIVHRLPVELKNYIFELLLPPRDEWGEITQPEGTVIPSYLASICRGWRDIAWSNPFLWSVMHIVLAKSNSISDASNFIRDRILRSRTLPLTLTIEIVGSSRAALAPILDTMSQCSNRLQSLSLDVPSAILCAFQHSNFQWHHLTQLRIISTFRLQPPINLPLSFFNPTASPENIELHGLVSLKSLQISWNRLSCARVIDVNLEDLTQLLQHASQMVECHVFYFRSSPGNFSMPPITHHMLKTLTLCYAERLDVVSVLGSVTLPCLQEFHTNEMVLLTHLPALVRRSSCPLTSLTLRHDFDDEMGPSHDFEPLPGVIDLVVETLREECQAVVIKKLLLEEYFPDLRHLTLRLDAFLSLWDIGIIPLYLDRKRPRPDGPNEGRLHTFLVVDQGSEFDGAEFGEELRALNITPTEDGFEFL